VHEAMAHTPSPSAALANRLPTLRFHTTVVGTSLLSMRWFSRIPRHLLADYCSLRGLLAVKLLELAHLRIGRTNPCQQRNRLSRHGPRVHIKPACLITVDQAMYQMRGEEKHRRAGVSLQQPGSPHEEAGLSPHRAINI
jgi:hypothetical protein